MTVQSRFPPISELTFANSHLWTLAELRRLANDPFDGYRVSSRILDAARERHAQQQTRRLALRRKSQELLAMIASIAPPSIGTLSGIAVPFETWGKPSQFASEIVGVNAVDALLAGAADVSFLVNHDTSVVFAQRSTFTLRLSKATEGLKIEADIPAGQQGEDLAAIIEGGQVVGFSFDVLPDSEIRQASTNKAAYVRTLLLSEISLILSPNEPAYPLVEPVTWQRKQ